MDSLPRNQPTRRRSPLDLIPEGTQFEKLTVISGPFLRYPRDSNVRYLYRCECECGGTCDARANNLFTGNTTTCGCGKRNAARTHGEHLERLYGIRGGLIQRCCNPNNPGYSDYGGRGITVCQEWRDSYEPFRDWALANGYRDDLTIERIDVNGNYEPSNCEWIPLKDQLKNTRKTVRLTVFGETKILRDWARDPRCPVSLGTITYRLSQGWDHDSAVATPPAAPNKKRRKLIPPKPTSFPQAD